MTAEQDGNDVPNNVSKLKVSSSSTKGLFSSLREKGEDVHSTPEGSSKSKTGSSFFPSPRSSSRSPVPVAPVSAVLSLNAGPLKNNITKLLTPSRTFTRLRDERDEISRLTPTPCTGTCFKDRINLPLVGEVRFAELASAAKKWLRNPKNLALLIWGLAVGVSGALLFMVMVGMLDHAVPDKSKRDTLFEVNNQILNALFTLMCVYLHPQRCFHLHMLIRWKPADILRLREVYCKNGTRKPHEWAHILVVVSLLQLNCWAQYALCGLNWGYRRADRPAIGVGLCLSLSLGGAAGAGIYNILSPLGKDFDLDSEEGSSEDVEKAGVGEAQPTKNKQYAARTKVYRLLERRLSFADRERGSSVEHPEWRGGLFDCGQDKPIAILSTVCCPCVFGWNMDRLGFGNRYVHIITFALLCTAPFWIFDLAAINIENRVVRHSIGATGIVLCAFGLLYGGFWRIRMRERYKLPANKCCCGYPNVADCAQWMFCPVCSLCQEVRTAEFYEVRDDKFYARDHRDVASPLPSSPPNGFPGTPPNGTHSLHTPAATLPAVKEMPVTGTKDMELNAISTNPFITPGEFMATNGRSPPRAPNPFLTPDVLATSFSPLAPPPAVTASRESSNSDHRVVSLPHSQIPFSSFESPSALREEAGSLTKPDRLSLHSEQDLSPAFSVDAKGSSSPLEHTVFPAVSNFPSLHNAQAPLSLPGSPARMFMAPEEGAYDYPGMVSPRRRSSFLQTDVHYQESPRRSVAAEEDGFVPMSPNNPFLEPKAFDTRSSPLSSDPKLTGDGSLMHMDENRQESPRLSSVEDYGIIMSPTNPFLERMMISNENSHLSSDLQNVGRPSSMVEDFSSGGEKQVG